MKKVWKPLVLWIAAWVPLCFLCQNHPDSPIPTAILAPMAGFFGMFDRYTWSGNPFWEITLPWLVFWGVTGAILFATWVKRHPK